MPDETCDLDTPVPDWVIEYPALTTLFDELGLTATCGGRSLDFECRRLGHDPATVLRLIETQLSETNDR